MWGLRGGEPIAIITSSLISLEKIQRKKLGILALAWHVIKALSTTTAALHSYKHKYSAINKKTTSFLIVGGRGVGGSCALSFLAAQLLLISTQNYLFKFIRLFV